MSQIFRVKRLAAAAGTAALLLFVSSAPGSAAQYPVYAAPDASVKFEVKPKQAKVYVDGFYAGIVDDFDSPFQRLYTAPGPHELTVFLEGYRTHTERAYLTPDHTFKVKFQMEKLGAGEVSEPPPTPTRPPAPQPPLAPRGSNGRRQRPPQNAPPDAQPNPQLGGQPPPPADPSARGTLQLTLQPADADVLVDGQSWQRSGVDRVMMDLPVGTHNIQVRKPGYVGYLTDVDIRVGETTTLDVNLRSQTPR